MALRTFYDSQIKIYNLLNEHPIMNKMISEFGIDIDNVKDVALYLLENHDEITATTLNNLYYNSEIIDTIGELFGFILPFEGQESELGTSVYEFLNFTLYLYKFGTTENFYEKHILDFLPEYDRENILSQPKLKLLYESIGRKFDDIELKVSKLKDIYDIDDVPEHLLDYLGQNLGYEKEDYTLKNVSFREVLKNIIEIYKIKGTNYSFSFFFKFLGFEISLKEFFFNRDVQNPEGFPSIESNKVEYYLTTKNPLYDISNNKPVKNLKQTKNINNWLLEMESLNNKGCINSIPYMLGFEPYNKLYDNPKWHSEPWTYFKTNLIEYELDPFFEKLNLTANDNETIKKYVKFLSPTYLFTWINVNLKPWVEDINIIQDLTNDFTASLSKTLGDPRPTPMPWPYERKTIEDIGFNGYNNDGIYYDYEPMDEILNIYKDGEEMIFSLYNNMNIGGHEFIGTTLKRDGTYIRQPGHPKFISNITHEGDKKISFDFMEVSLKDYIDNNLITYVNYYEDLPSTTTWNSIYYVRFTSEESEMSFGYYRYIDGWDYITFDDYSYRPFPATPIKPTPDNNQTLSESNILEFTWEEIKGGTGYWLQLATDAKFNNIVLDLDYLIDNKYNTYSALLEQQNLLANAENYILPNGELVELNYYPHEAKFSNNKYYWRIKVKNSSDFPHMEDKPYELNWSPWSNNWQFTLKTFPFPYNEEYISKETMFIKTNKINNVFSNAYFNIGWNNISETEKYNLQVLKSKPYVWQEINNINFYNSLDDLENDLETGTIVYIVDEQNFYKYTGIEFDWVNIPYSENYSIIESYDLLPNREQLIGDTWFVENETIIDDIVFPSGYYTWKSIENEWILEDNKYNVLGNTTNINALEQTNEEIYSIYFVQASNSFYQYVPIEETSFSILTEYDVETENNIYPVILKNGTYYWRIRSYHKSGIWKNWSQLREFTINFA